MIVYTGRSLTRDEEQRLRRFSKSIIIKDARSPERLLDEVTLFLHQVESTLPAERQRMLQQARHRESALEGRRILVVEDDARNIFALSSVLELKGATVRSRETAGSARRADASGCRSRRKVIDLVLMDIMMPEMDGLTAMREIRKRPNAKSCCGAPLRAGVGLQAIKPFENSPDKDWVIEIGNRNMDLRRRAERRRRAAPVARIPRNLPAQAVPPKRIESYCPLNARSRISTVCITGMSAPIACRCVRICVRQPMLPLATASAPVVGLPWLCARRVLRAISG